MTILAWMPLLLVVPAVAALLAQPDLITGIRIPVRDSAPDR